MNKRTSTIIVSILLLQTAYLLADVVSAANGRNLEAAPIITAPTDTRRKETVHRRDWSDYAAITERGLFGDGTDPSGPPETVEMTNYKLIGTIEGEFFSGAVVEDSKGQAFYSVHQKLPDGAEIVRVLGNLVIIKRVDGSMAELRTADDTTVVTGVKKGRDRPFMKKTEESRAPDNGQDAALTTNASGQIAEAAQPADQAKLTSTLENMFQLLKVTQAGAQPFVDQGKTAGFRISEIEPGSLNERIGLQGGDVIQKINSQDMDDSDKFLKAYQGMKDEGKISIEVLRNNRRQTLNYESR
jgi:type II secretion system protein C